jgi:hypothetical protein
VPGLSDAQLAVELSTLVSGLGDGHAFVEAPDDRDDLHLTLPVQFHLFEEGLFVTAVAEAYEHLLGAQVLAFDGEPAERVFAGAAERLVGQDNAQGPRGFAAWRLGRTALLHALGLLREPGAATLAVRLADGAASDEHVAAQPLPPLLSRAMPCPPGWRFLPDTRPGPLPLYLRNCGAAYWATHEEGLVYFQFNSVADDADEPLDAFTRRLFDRLDADRLVIDLRWNGGGNTFLILPLLHRLIACERVNRPGGLFVIVGRRTFSAAQNFATLVGNHTHALFVGEPTGSSPNFVGETAPFRLPYSRFTVNVSDLYWQTSWPMDHRTWIAPDLYAPPTFAGFAAGRDPAMDAILAVVAAGDDLPGR